MILPLLNLEGRASAPASRTREAKQSSKFEMILPAHQNCTIPAPFLKNFSTNPFLHHSNPLIPMHSHTIINQFIELRSQGLSLSRIAEQLNVSKRTLVDWNRAHQATIDSLRALELE